jgi:type I restriction enzyme S subunit
MNKIDQLLQKYCPEGVNKTTLGAIGVFGNVGVDKKIIKDQTRVKLMNYMDVYNNQFIDDNSIRMIVSAPENKIKSCSISMGDIFITPTSETRDDIGHSAVALENIEGAVYSYHIMRYRLNDFNMTLSFFINYLFRSEQIKKQIYELATGMTRYGLTKAKFESIEIPLPPLPVQEEIVRILDEFTELEAELKAELEARTKQYEYYRNTLLDFSTGKVGFPRIDQLLQKY